MQYSPKISIVTVAFNSANTLVETIRSVVAQIHDNIEYIMVDGGSTDGTLKIVDHYRDHVSILISEPDEGIYDAMNKGVRAATGDVVGTLNSDDFFADADVLSRLANQVTAHPEIEAFYANLLFVSEEDISTITRTYFARRYAFWKARFGFMLPHPTFYARPALFGAHGYYNTSYRVAADFELMFRFSGRGVTFRHLDYVMVHMREGGVSPPGFCARLNQNHEIVRACWEKRQVHQYRFRIEQNPLQTPDAPHVRTPCVWTAPDGVFVHDQWAGDRQGRPEN